jgi:hypothetical protein
MDFPFFSPYTVFRGNGNNNNNNAFWHHSSGGGAKRSPQFIHPPMKLVRQLQHLMGADMDMDMFYGHLRHGHGGMDFLHPPMMW